MSRKIVPVKTHAQESMPPEQLTAITAEHPAAGRPRSQQARTSILDAAYKLLYKAAARDISVSQIADEAGVSTATLYRWWPTKEAVLVEAFIAKLVEYAPTSGGTPLDILVDDVLQTSELFQGKHARVALRLLLAVHEDKSLKKLLLEQLYRPRAARQLNSLTKAIQQGQLPANADGQLFLDLVFGLLLARVVIGHAPVNDQVVRKAFDVVVAGLRSFAPA